MVKLIEFKYPIIKFTPFSTVVDYCTGVLTVEENAIYKEEYTTNRRMKMKKDDLKICDFCKDCFKKFGTCIGFGTCDCYNCDGKLVMCNRRDDLWRFY